MAGNMILPQTRTSLHPFKVSYQNELSKLTIIVLPFS